MVRSLAFWMLLTNLGISCFMLGAGFATSQVAFLMAGIYTLLNACFDYFVVTEREISKILMIIYYWFNLLLIILMVPLIFIIMPFGGLMWDDAGTSSYAKELLFTIKMLGPVILYVVLSFLVVQRYREVDPKYLVSSEGVA